MKSVFIFFIGLFTGVILTCMIGGTTDINTTSDEIPGLTMFEEKGECISKKSIKVFQSLGMAGLGIDKGNSSFADLYNGIHVLIKSPSDKPFYDDQIVVIPKNKCARQVGIYQYETTEKKWKTVPVVEID